MNEIEAEAIRDRNGALAIAAIFVSFFLSCGIAVSSAFDALARAVDSPRNEED